MFAKTENLPVAGLFISIFIAIVTGFVIGALIENLAFKDVHSDVKKVLEEEMKGVSDLNAGMFADIYAKLNARDPLIVGLNFIDSSGIILYSDELSIIGKTFSDPGKVYDVFGSEYHYAIDRNLISQETILKETYRHLLTLFYHFEERRYTLQVLYDIEATEKDVLQITSLLWFTILLSVAILFVLLAYISTLTHRNLQKAKEDLEIEVKKRTRDLEELSASLDKQVKERNKELESAIKSINKQNADLVKTSIELTELRDQLEDKNYELEKANMEILRLMEAKTDFMNKAAHDLRTHITPILLLIPPIKKRIKDIGILYDLKVIEKNANYLKQIADDLISYLKSSTGRYQYIFKKTDIKGLIEDVLVTYREAFNQNKTEIIKRIPENLPLVEADELKIAEVLQNLVSNALKFMPRVGKLTIDIKKRDNFINVEFKDTGIGMSKKTLSKLFVEFYKADKSRHIPGEGLGLSICKRIIGGHQDRKS